MPEEQCRRDSRQRWVDRARGIPELGPPESIGNFGDFAQEIKVIVVENGEYREFWSRDGVSLGRVFRPEARGKEKIEVL
jgi:hypothetical protein